MARGETGTVRGLDPGDVAHDVSTRKPEPSADNEHEPTRTRRRQRPASCDVAVEDRAEDGGIDVVEAGTLGEAQRGRTELTGQVERSRDLPVEHDRSPVSSKQVPRVDVPVGEHDGA